MRCVDIATNRKNNAEDTAVAPCALDLDAPAMALHDGVHQRQTQAATFGVAGRIHVKALKGLEEPGLLVCRQAATLVLDRHDPMVRFSVQAT